MVTFVLATYAMVIIVHISNISAVSGPILSKLFGPNFFGVMMFVDQNVLGQNFFLSGPKVFRPEILLDPKKISKSNFLPTQNCLMWIENDTNISPWGRSKRW